MDGHACQIWLPQDGLGASQEMERERRLEAYYGFSGFARLPDRTGRRRRPVGRQQYSCCQKRGQEIGYDGHKKVNGSKVHAVVTPSSLPVAIDLGPGDEHESRRLFPLLKGIRISGTRRPRSKPRRVYADTKYNTPLVMMYLASRGIAARIKERVNKKRRPGRPRIFDNETYTRIRSGVERFFAWMKSFRRIQTRYDRLVSTYLGFLQLGCVMILMRRVSR